MKSDDSKKHFSVYDICSKLMSADISLQLKSHLRNHKLSVFFSVLKICIWKALL